MQMTAIKLPQTSEHVLEIEFYAWLAQAEPGETLTYHRGFLVVDTDPVVSKLTCDARMALCAVADAAFRAAAQDLVHLVQLRLATDRFAYVAIARPKPTPPRAAFAARLLEAA
jgi:hypothetical protein